MKVELREIINRMVEEILDESNRRDDYVNRIVDGLKGPYGEYMKARYAELNTSQRKKAGKGTTQGWDREAKERLFDLSFAFARRLKSGDRRKAFLEALDEFRDLVPFFVRHSCSYVAKCFGLDESQMIDPSDVVTDDFFANVEKLFDEMVKS